MKEKLNSVIQLGKEFASGMGERRLTVYATSGCYYLFMSLVPIVMIFCCILPYTPFNQDMILAYINQYFAESLANILRSIANAVYSSNSATLTVSIFLTLFSASASMKALMKGMDSAYNFKNKDNVVVVTIRALIYMVLLVATLLLSLVIMVYGGKILQLLQKYLSYVGILNPILSKGRYFLVMFVLTVVFLLLYRIMPSERVNIKDQLPGSVFSAVTWVIFSSIFTIYISVSNKFGAYGFIGTIMVTMMWMYYCLFFLLIGGFMNSFLSSRKATEEGFILVTDAGKLPESDLDGGSDGNLVKSSCSDSSSEEDANAGASSAVSNGSVGIVSGDVLDQDIWEEELYIEDSGDNEAEEEASSGKKKIPIPLIAGAAVCGLAALGGGFFFVKKKKKKKAEKAKKTGWAKFWEILVKFYDWIDSYGEPKAVKKKKKKAKKLRKKNG